MSKVLVLMFVFAAAATSRAAEVRFDFSNYPAGQCPTNFLSVVSGSGRAGDWKVIQAAVEPDQQPFSPKAPQTSARFVLAQTAREAVGNHFPLLLYNGETFADFTFTTKFRLVDGDMARMAGVVFRAKDSNNYYVVCASALDGFVRFYKCVGGVQSKPIGKKTEISTNVWHELSVSCKGNQIVCKLDGKESLPEMQDTSLTVGHIGFWTKSDAVSQFVDARVEYTPVVPFTQKLVEQTMKRYSRLRGLRLYVPAEKGKPRLAGSNKPEELGSFGGQTEASCLESNATFYLKLDKAVEITLPLRDRNGDIVAALKVTMPTFAGEPEKNAVNRATLIRKDMERQMGAVSDITQ
jgi:hypothetical protein